MDADRKLTTERDYMIRPAIPEDVADMVAILNPIISRGGLTRLTEPATIKSQLTFIRQFPEPGIFLVAVSHINGRILGMQDVMPCDKRKGVGAISTFVSLPYLRKGIGRELMKNMLPSAKTVGFAELNATIRTENAGAIAYYQSAGFSLRHPDELPGEPIISDGNSIELVRILDPPPS